MTARYRYYRTTENNTAISDRLRQTLGTTNYVLRFDQVYKRFSESVTRVDRSKYYFKPNGPLKQAQNKTKEFIKLIITSDIYSCQ